MDAYRWWRALVRVLKADEIALQSEKLCYHIKEDGKKVHQQLFEATQIEVEEQETCYRSQATTAARSPASMLGT